MRSLRRRCRRRRARSDTPVRCSRSRFGRCMKCSRPTAVGSSRRYRCRSGRRRSIPATGREGYIPFVAVGADRDSFLELDLSNVVPAATLSHLGAVVSKNPYRPRRCGSFGNPTLMTDERLVFNPPPGWPKPPDGWVPPKGWSPDPAWPDPPEGWQLWLSAGSQRRGVSREGSDPCAGSQPASR